MTRLLRPEASHATKEKDFSWSLYTWRVCKSWQNYQDCVIHENSKFSNLLVTKKLTLPDTYPDSEWVNCRPADARDNYGPPSLSLDAPNFFDRDAQPPEKRITSTVAWNRNREIFPMQCSYDIHKPTISHKTWQYPFGHSELFWSRLKRRSVTNIAEKRVSPESHLSLNGAVLLRPQWRSP